MMREQCELRRPGGPAAAGCGKTRYNVGQIGLRLVACIGRDHALVHLYLTTAGEISANLSKLTMTEEERAAEAQCFDPFQHAAR